MLDVALGAQHEGLARTHAGARPVRCWVVIECSQVSRSGPVTVTTPRWERSTTARPSVEQPLLAHRVAVVGRDARVGALALDGAGAGQQGELERRCVGGRPVGSAWRWAAHGRCGTSRATAACV